MSGIISPIAIAAGAHAQAGLWLDLGVAGELLARTSSTFRVQQIVQLSLAPAFLLGAIAAMLNVMNLRLATINKRVDYLCKREEDGRLDREVEELPALQRRQRYAHLAINFSTIAALFICVVIALMFVGALIRPMVGTVVALFWIMAMAMVFSALTCFMLETRLATRSARELRLLSHRINGRLQAGGRGGEGQGRKGQGGEDRTGGGGNT